MTLSVSLASLSCAHVNVPNVEVCADLGEFGASCANTNNDQTRRIDQPKWDEYRYGQLCVTPAGFASWKGVIEKLCGKTDMCTFEEKALLKSIDEKVYEMNFKASYLKDKRR